MNDQNKNKQESPQNRLGEASAAKSGSGMKKLFAKRWVSPAIFMAAAAIIVTLMWVYQGSDNAVKQTTGTEPSDEIAQGDDSQTNSSAEEDIVDVIASGEDMKWPVADYSALKQETLYYDVDASESEKEAALVQVGNMFSAHTGIDFTDPKGTAFDVMAALSGKVTYVKQHPKNGNQVEISHGNGLVTVYQILSDVQVAEGDEVKQGTVIAKAGRSDLESDLGVHLHFETRLNGEAVNPKDYISE